MLLVVIVEAIPFVAVTELIPVQSSDQLLAICWNLPSAMKRKEFAIS